ncbi:MAG: M3 family metallopeptidase [Acidobacteria bacterium]|nr:M3 family metallopeptidase [Acidobacteriota bacterium]
MKRVLALIAAVTSFLSVSTEATTRMPDEANPFFSVSTLPYQAPPFDRIGDADYLPAFEEGMKQHDAEIAAIAGSAEAPTFENTIVAMERSGELLGRVGKVFFALAQSNTNPAIQKIQAEIAPKLSAHNDAILLNPKLFARVKSIYDRREKLGLDADSKFLVFRVYRQFVRGGAQLTDADKETLKALNQEQATLSTSFRAKLLAASNAAAVVVDTREELDGLSADEVASAAQRAKDRGLDGKYVIALTNTTRQPITTAMTNRALRLRIHKASVERGRSGENDTRPIATRLAQIRAQKARLFGFPNHAAYSLDDQMAETPARAEKLLTDLVAAATAKARGEAAKMQALIDAEKGGFKLEAGDWSYYAEKVRKAEYDLDESQVKPYFELNRVLEHGVFFAANKMYGITFKERKDIPVYHPDVRVFEVFDADGSSLALFYADYFARPSKAGGAWMSSFVDQNGLTGTKPVVFNVCNFPKPAPGDPALLTYDHASTMFHEFGHALHGIFSAVKYPTISGTAVPRDFVEYPSQFNEHWALEPSVLANYARHFKTGEPMPRDLVEKIRKASTFNQGYDTTEYLAAALLDMAWHTLPADAAPQDPDVFEQAALAKYGIAVPEVPPRYRTTIFSHIWGGGYAAGYYAYLWSEVLDQDTYYWFRENGGMTRKNGQRYRDMILSRGLTKPAAAMFKAFRGRDPIVEPLIVERGLKPEKKK